MEGEEHPSGHEDAGEDTQEDGGEDVGATTAAAFRVTLVSRRGIPEIVLARTPATRAARLHHGVAGLIRQRRTGDTLFRN